MAISVSISGYPSLVSLLEELQAENESLEQSEALLRDQVSFLERQPSEAHMEIKEKEEAETEVQACKDSCNTYKTVLDRNYDRNSDKPSDKGICLLVPVNLITMNLIIQLIYNGIRLYTLTNKG